MYRFKKVLASSWSYLDYNACETLLRGIWEGTGERRKARAGRRLRKAREGVEKLGKAQSKAGAREVAEGSEKVGGDYGSTSSNSR